MENKIMIPENGKIKVYWDDKPENYSRDSKNRLRKYFSKKYGVQSQNINIIYRPVRTNKAGELIEIEGGSVDNILSVPYQRELFKEWLEREGKDIDFERIIKLDKKVNNELEVEINDKATNNYKIKWLKIDNFLSFGPDNYFAIDKYNGFTVVNSTPANQGGKCVRYNTIISVKIDSDSLNDKVSELPYNFNSETEIEIGKLNEIYEEYGDLGFKVKTQYGYHKITWCGITEKDAETYRCELDNGMFIEGADKHRLKKPNGDWVTLDSVNNGDIVQTINGDSKVVNVRVLETKYDLYDIQVDEVHEYYANGIVSHNTTLVVDAIKFLLFGTTTKTDKNEQVFNQFSKDDELVLRGMIEVDSDKEFIIERRLKRKAKRKGGWSIENKLNYYEILPDGEEVLMNDEDAKKTTNIIKETVGNESDFDLVVLATSRNLDNLVDATTTESGKLLSRFIGLETITLKEGIVRKMYSAFSKTMKSNIYDSETLKEEITIHENNIDELSHDKKLLNQRLLDQKEIQEKLNKDKVKLIESKDKVDVNILTLNPSKLNIEIEAITNQGIKFKKDIEDINIKLKEIGEVEFDEDKDFKLNKEFNAITNTIAFSESSISKLEKTIKDLVESGICKACNRPLDDVDNTKHISEHKTEIESLEKLILTNKTKLEEVKKGIEVLSLAKSKINEKNKLELSRDRLDVELNNLRSKLRDKKSDLDKYTSNIDAIEKNKTIDSEISNVDTKLKVCEHEREVINNELQKNAINHDRNSKDIDSKTILIKKIKEEIEVEKLFKIYIEMVGKKGISKLVLRSVLPIINSEIQRLLDDITDFDVEVYVDDKNDVRYLLIKDDVEKPLKSGSGFELTTASIALRCVLGKISSLPRPNFIAFDEVLGRVAPDNIAAMRPLFERISDMFDTVFFITQNELVKDWSDGIITVVKDNNISKLK